MLTNGISLIKSRSLKSHSRPLKQSVKSPVFMSTKSFNNSLDPLQSSQSHSSDIIRPGTSHASERNHTRAVMFLSGLNLVQSPGRKQRQKHPRRRGKEVGLKLIERIKCKQTGKDGDKHIPTTPPEFNGVFLLYSKQLRTFSPISIEGKVGDLTKERDRASAKTQKSGGSKTNEMFKIIKEQALKFEEESHWLMSKLVKLTSSNQVLGREVEAEVKYGPYSIPCMPLKCNLIPGMDCGW
ncbi:hypothetical protein BY996DRAFT_6411901 [Phakopsora pachyrhizi]|nr:hypothetical protein BY996DRAFT_6411901 [Phakopsora pachyrhizi]